MYLSIPEDLSIIARYINKESLNIEYLEILYECKHREHEVIGVTLPNQRELRWVRDKEAMEDEAKQQNVLLKIVYSEFNLKKQDEQVEELIKEGVDLLIITPVVPEVEAELVKDAHNEGIKVISYEELIKNSDVDLFIAFNNLMIGELQGKYLTKKVPRGNYIILSGDAGGNSFKRGAMEYIQPLVSRGEIRIVTDKIVDNWDPKNGYNIVKESLMANNNRVDAILAPNDAIAGAAIEALKEQGLAGRVAVTGQDADIDAIRRIIDGTQSMTVFKDTRQLGKTAIDVAIKFMRGEAIETTDTVNNGKVDVPSILLTPVSVDSSNVNTAILGTGFYKFEDVYKRLYSNYLNV
ncbi:sugar ABC transporter substrate-binding protein [Clostridium sp. 'White wine YQ']|uniref:sugar ABC transporter substrate-binding protein n=1 Tax=Clostridium sp. 'White wine YQ' TaxID=3027474 RepID=UPI0023650CE2|nr:substrate-binding domain-containing protein [Clostridium sp. 'White wine YQ']MDD7794341.1 substrate-binding domain-containing protein [Clostridium sp. 'White wine YQ']